MNQATDEQKQNILDRVTRSEVASMVLAMTRAPRMRMTSTIPSWGHSDDRFGMVSAIKAGDISAAFDHAAVATNRYFCDFCVRHKNSTLTHTSRGDARRQCRG